MSKSKITYEFGFDKIIVIESLPKGNRKTGEELSTVLSYLKDDFKTNFFDVENKVDFFIVLDELINVSERGNIPYLHFEIHGSDERDGLILKNNDFIEWKVLADKLRILNKRTDNNLFISFATCFGLHMYQEVLPNKPSPCYGFIGSWEELYEKEVLLGFEAFFKALLSSNLEMALVELNKYSNTKCNIYFSSEIFERIFEKYLSSELIPKKVSERKYNIIRQYLCEFRILPNKKQIDDIEREIRNPAKLKIMYERIFNHIHTESYYFYENLLNLNKNKYF